MVILGWLGYAFWGWLILAVVWLAWVVAATFITSDALDTIVPYALAAAIVLLPIAFTTDLFYRRKEPSKKTGAMMVVMVIHAVIFALFGIGFLISAVFVALNMLIGEAGSSEYKVVWIITSLVATVLYAAAFLRTLNPFKTMKVASVYAYAMLGSVLLLLVAGVLGPLAQSISLRTDRQLESNLDNVHSAVSQYVNDNNRLPSTLKEVNYDSSEARAIVDDGLVTYKKDSPSLDHVRYQLCVEFKKASSYYSEYNDQSWASGDDGYDTYLEASYHPAGNVCYKLKVATDSTSYNDTQSKILEGSSSDID